MSEYPIKIREPVEPGDTAPMPFQVARAGRIVDVVGLPPDVVLVQAALGRVRWNHEVTKGTIAEYLAAQPYDANAGAYCVFTVQNNGTKPVVVTGKVIVQNEQGPAVETKIRSVAADERPSDTRAAAAAAPADPPAPRRRDPVNDAKVEAIIDSAEQGSDVSVLRGPRGASGGGVAPSGIRRPQAPMISMTGIVKPQNVLSKKQRKERLLKQAAAAAASMTSLVVADTDRYVLLHAGHAEMLELALTARAPLDDASRPEIAAAFATAPETTAGEADAPAPSIGEVLLRFSAEDFTALADALDGHAEYAIDDTDRMALAIRHGLLGTTPTGPAPAPGAAKLDPAFASEALSAGGATSGRDDVRSTSDGTREELKGGGGGGGGSASERKVVPLSLVEGLSDAGHEDDEDDFDLDAGLPNNPSRANARDR